MRRREFLGVLGGATIAWPCGARAQDAGRVYRFGGLHPLPRTAPQFVPLFDGLRRQGFLQGRNLEVRGFGSSAYRQQAAEIIEAGVDVLFCGGDPAVRVAQEVTRTVPIAGVADDMVGSGLVASLAHPGGNTTGFSILSSELDGKRQELLIELMPTAGRMAALFDPATTSPARLKTVVDAAKSRGVEVSTHPAAKLEDIVPSIDAAHAAGAKAVNVLAAALLHSNRQVIFERTAALRMPAIYQFPESAEQGGFASNGPRIEQMIYPQLAMLVARLFRGDRPQDIPVQQPTTFELVINLTTARSVGLTIPEGLLVRADKVID
jgi:putative ABC transport system substrate-binding protein